ncbi:Zn-ribbon domain-containing OB-fold protein [Rhodococcus sp. UNC363MFTsu5.1]|uniref:Zn-ribbon domain-containing OB-fold protein n=1 Tax=Rhodococcus sp. UNC363MFTsu5.1 TaxID=1449069 RepID=UPI0005674D5A|nr:OB-fold domain-containing protein [Rhodococcus sp. UNC363MFTsu5.1]
MILRCEACATLLAPEETACSTCGRDELERVRAAGTGTVVSWTVVDCSSADLPLALVPCTLAIVELDEGPWIYTWIEGELPVHPDRSVRVEFLQAESGERFPVFAVRRVRQEVS